MDDASFAALTRRASLLALGAAGLAAFAGPVAVDAKNKHKKKKKSDVNKLCKVQGKDWAAYVTSICAGKPTCLDELVCSEPLARCNFGDFHACFVANIGA